MPLLRFKNIDQAIRFSLQDEPEKWKLVGHGTGLLFGEEEIELFKSIRKDFLGNDIWIFVTPVGMIDLSFRTNRLLQKWVREKRMINANQS